jgi:hypothetical protein
MRFAHHFFYLSAKRTPTLSIYQSINPTPYISIHQSNALLSAKILPMAPAKKKTLKERLLSMFGARRSAADARAAEPRPDFASIVAGLRKEQSRLSAEVERTLALYDDRTRALAKRLAEAGDARAIEKICADQEDLWRTLRRLQAALRTTRDLESELREWAARAEEGELIGHPEHPVTRIEIVASELRARGRDPFALLQAIRARKFAGSAEDVDPIGDAVGAQFIAPGLESEARGTEEEEYSTQPTWSREDVEHILREICDHAREARRMRAHVDAPELVRELAWTIADFRRYHGHLRLLDRADGIRRDRLAIAEIDLR